MSTTTCTHGSTACQRAHEGDRVEVLDMGIQVRGTVQAILGQHGDVYSVDLDVPFDLTSDYAVENFVVNEAELEKI